MAPEISAEVAARLLDFVARMDDVVGVCDEHGRVLYLNAAARKQLGLGDATGLTTADLFAPEAFASYYDEVRPALLHSGTWSGELPIRSPAGDTAAMQFSVVASVGPGGEITGLVTHGRADPKAPGAVHPPGEDAADLVDRATAAERLAAVCARGDGSRHTAVVYAELRGVRELFERHGGFVADGVMRTVARRLTTVVRATDMVLRIGRNAFLVAFADVQDVAQALRLVHSLEAEFDREPIWTAAGDVAATLRFGLVLARADDDSEEAIRRAELSDSGVAQTRPAVRVATRDDDELAALTDGLRPAVMHGDVRTFVRPVVALPERRIAGYEAFARWTEPSGAVVDGRALEDLAERAGVASAIALRVLREAAAFVMTSPSDDPLQLFVAAPAPLVQDVYLPQYLWEVGDALSLRPSQVSLLVDVELVRQELISPAALGSLGESGARVVMSGVEERDDVDALTRVAPIVDVRLAPDVLRAVAAGRLARVRIEDLVATVHRRRGRVIAPGIVSEIQHDLACEVHVDLAWGDFYGLASAADVVA
jgi:EAL domain-containing protein (putative c-di-GMP-specific phosphodiesterase class I)/GGDEF domain-containing protein